jgi:hypothetical protein
VKRATGMSMSTCHHIYVYFRKAYTNKKTGELYKVGEIATFPLLADTLETIANNSRLLVLFHCVNSSYVITQPHHNIHIQSNLY